MTLAAYGGVFFDAAVPGEAGDGVSEGDPEGLDNEAADEVRSGGFAHVNADREKELVGEGGELENASNAGRQDVQWEEMAAGDVFEGVKDEDESGNFENPKRKHGHGVGGEELEHRRHNDRDEEPAERGPIWRQDEIFAQAQNEYGQWKGS